VSEPKTLQDVRWIDCEAPEMTEANALEVGAEIAKHCPVGHMIVEVRQDGFAVGGTWR